MFISFPHIFRACIWFLKNFITLLTIFFHIVYQEEATHLHLLVTVFHTKPTSNLAVVTVVVGRATVEASKEAPHVMALAAVPVIAIQRV